MYFVNSRYTLLKKAGDVLQKLNNVFYRVILAFTVVCFSVALIGSVFLYFDYSCLIDGHSIGNIKLYNPIVISLGAVLLIFALFKMLRVISLKSERWIKTAVPILLLVQFCLLYLSTVFIKSVPDVDLVHILNAVNSLNKNGYISNAEYFSVYPFNRFLLMIIYLLSRISVKHCLTVFNVFSCLCICTSSYFTYKTVYKIFGEKKALLSLAVCVFSPIFYLYASYYYTDIVALPFASICFYLIVKAEEYSGTAKRILFGVSIGFFAVTAYLVRSVSVFILIAYFVFYILKNGLKKTILKFLPIVLSFALFFASFSFLQDALLGKRDKSKAFPLTHWVMMGSSAKKLGFYNQADYELTYNSEDKVKDNITEYKNRVKANGIKGNLMLFAVKSGATFGRGDYAYQKYLTTVEDYNSAYDFVSGNKNIAVNYLLQIFNVSLLLLALFTMIKQFKYKEKCFLAIALFGAVFFYSFWETCPRYGLTFLPWIIIYSNYGLDTFAEKIEQIKLGKWFKISVLLITVTVFAFGTLKYTSPHTKTDIAVSDQSQKLKAVTLKCGDVAEQTVLSSKSFNGIYLKIDGNEKPESSDFKLEVIGKEKTVFSMCMNSASFKKGGESFINFYKNIPKGRYTVKITSLSEKTVKVMLSFMPEYDFYKNGTLRINGDLSDGDLYFRAVNINRSPIYTYLEYGIIFLAVILLEYLILFTKKQL